MNNADVMAIIMVGVVTLHHKMIQNGLMEQNTLVKAGKN
jgi:hypothetical protein